MEPNVPVHGPWFWKLAIFEGVTGTFVAMGGAILAASATWDSAALEKMERWQWCIFWLGVIIVGIKNMQSFMSKTVETLTAQAKAEDKAAGVTVTVPVVEVPAQSKPLPPAAS